MLDNWTRILTEQYRPMVPPRTARIIDLLATNPGRRFTSGELVNTLGLKSEKELFGLLSPVTKGATKAGIDQTRSGSWFVGWGKSRQGGLHYFLTQERADWWNGHHQRRYWALLAKPEFYDIETAVEELEVDWWTTGRSDLLPGDRVIIWKAKGRDKHRGIVALGEVVGPRELLDDSANHHRRRIKRSEEKERVGIRYKKCPNLPLWTGGSHEKLLLTLTVSRGQGTAFKVTPEQWESVLLAAGGWSERESSDSPWAEWEVEQLVRTYLEALKARPTKKSRKADEIIRSLAVGTSRSSDEIVTTLGMVSAVLEGNGIPSVEAWASYYPVDPAIERAVIRLLGDDLSFRADSAPERPDFDVTFIWSDDLLSAPPLRGEDEVELVRLSSPIRPVKIDFLARQHKNQLLGEGGERWVLEYERARLQRAGLSNLAKRVRWVSKEDGDGLGYDIASFDNDGNPIFIEVKTTSAGSLAPFIVTRNEILQSEELGDAYRLYRVFRYPERPRLFILTGPIAGHLHLVAETFRASF